MTRANPLRGQVTFQAFEPIATWTRPPLPTAMSQAEYSNPAFCCPLPTTGMAWIFWATSNPLITFPKIV